MYNLFTKCNHLYLGRGCVFLGAKGGGDTLRHGHKESYKDLNLKNSTSQWDEGSNLISSNPKYEKNNILVIFGGTWRALTSNPALPNFQGSKTSSQSRQIYNKGTK